DYRKNQEPAVEKLKEPILDEVTSAFSGGTHLILQDMRLLHFVVSVQASFVVMCHTNPSVSPLTEASLLNTTVELVDCFPLYEFCMGDA
ncbi:hypothetical protein IFM89_036558, partial [Coptis chinensis]